MSQNPIGQQTCAVCQQSFDSEQELLTHQNHAHGENESGERRSNYDIETEQPTNEKSRKP